jgi:hypothetical protein
MLRSRTTIMGKAGTWWLRSKKDRRWNCSGQSGAYEALAKGYRVTDAGEQVRCTGGGGETLVADLDAAGLMTRLTAGVVPPLDLGTGEGSGTP